MIQSSGVLFELKSIHKPSSSVPQATASNHNSLTTDPLRRSFSEASNRPASPELQRGEQPTTMISYSYHLTGVDRTEAVGYVGDLDETLPQGEIFTMAIDCYEKTRLSVFSSQLSEKGLSVFQSTGQPKTDKHKSENRQPKTDNRKLSKNLAPKVADSVVPRSQETVTEPSPEAILTPQFPSSVKKADPLGDLLTPSNNRAIRQYDNTSHRRFPLRPLLGITLIILSAVGVLPVILPKAQQEVTYHTIQQEKQQAQIYQEAHPLPPAVPLTFNPMAGPDGKHITPINTDFSIVIPSLGINSPVIANVSPLNAKEYGPALQKGVAHASTSYLPNQDGAVYLFSHSTNYQWFVKDLNAIFYNLKYLKDGEYIVLFYKGKRYTYKYINSAIASPSDTTYLLPVTGKRQLILQTCWPPGSTTERLLIFADLVNEKGESI